MIHRFVNTTPNPRATKNNRGLLVPELESPPLFVSVGVGDGDNVDDSESGGVEAILEVTAETTDEVTDDTALATVEGGIEVGEGEGSV